MTSPWAQSATPALLLLFSSSRSRTETLVTIGVNLEEETDQYCQAQDTGKSPSHAKLKVQDQGFQNKEKRTYHGKNHAPDITPGDGAVNVTYHNLVIIINISTIIIIICYLHLLRLRPHKSIAAAPCRSLKTEMKTLQVMIISGHFFRVFYRAWN